MTIPRASIWLVLALSFSVACDDDKTSSPADGSLADATSDGGQSPEVATEVGSPDTFLPPEAGEDAPSVPDAVADSDGGDAQDGDADVKDGAFDDVPERFRALARAIENERALYRVPGVAVAVVEKGEVTFARGFGFKDPRGTAPVQPTTLFRIGSSTKMLTSAAVLRGVQDGQLGLDDAVSKHLPTFKLTRSPGAGEALKLRHLLSHGSGLIDYAEEEARPDEMSDSALESFFTRRFSDIGYVQSPPGAVWAYSNSGIALATLLAEKAAARPYRQLLKDRVLTPLGMNRTVFLASEVVADGDFAVGLNCTPGDAACGGGGALPVIEPTTYDLPWAWSAGFAWSSVMDLAKFTRFLVHGQESVLRADLHQAMTSAQINTRQYGDVVSYGFGTIVGAGFHLEDGYHPDTIVGHGGDIPGFAAEVNCVPKADFCFISLANINGVHFLGSLSFALQSLANVSPPVTPPDVAPRPERHPAYAGTYADPFVLGEVRVTADGGTLSVEIPSFEQSKTPYSHELTPVAVDNFLIDIGGAKSPVTFLADDAGTYKYIRSRPFVMTRSPATPTPKP